jgi:hypothetical protein
MESYDRFLETTCFFRYQVFEFTFLHSDIFLWNSTYIVKMDVFKEDPLTRDKDMRTERKRVCVCVCVCVYIYVCIYIYVYVQSVFACVRLIV